MSAKKRVIQFIDLQGISNRKFAEKILVSPMYFSRPGAIGSDILEKISKAYPELNIDWVVTGRGNMLAQKTNLEEISALPVSGQVDAALTSDIMDMPITIADKIGLLRNRVALQALEIQVLKRILDQYVSGTVKEGKVTTNG